MATLGRVAPSSARYARHLSRFNGRAYPKIGVCLPIQAAPPIIAGIATTRKGSRNDRGICYIVNSKLFNSVLTQRRLIIKSRAAVGKLPDCHAAFLYKINYLIRSLEIRVP